MHNPPRTFDGIKKIYFRSRNCARKLIFGQNVHSYKAKNVTRAIFDILKISIMAAIFMSKMAIFDIKMATIMEIALVTFFA